MVLSIVFFFFYLKLKRYKVVTVIKHKPNIFRVFEGSRTKIFKLKSGNVFDKLVEYQNKGFIILLSIYRDYRSSGLKNLIKVTNSDCLMMDKLPNQKKSLNLNKNNLENINTIVLDYFYQSNKNSNYKK